MTGAEVAARVAARCRDSAYSEITAAKYLLFVNDAIADLVSAGWYTKLNEDETILLSAGTYAYTVTAGFISIYELRVENADGDYDTIIPRWQWRLGYDAGAAKIFLDSRYFTMAAGMNIKIVGQCRFAEWAVGGAATADPPIISFLRERAVYYAATALMAGTSEIGSARARIAEQAWNLSEMLLMNTPYECRILPGSSLVPGA